MALRTGRVKVDQLTGLTPQHTELLKQYMDMEYAFVVKEINDDAGTYYHATIEELYGCQSTGLTEEEARQSLREAMEGYFETKIVNGIAIPRPMQR